MRCGGIFDIDNRKNLLAELEKKAAAPDFWDNQTAAKVVIAKSNSHRAVLKPFDKLQSILDDAGVMLELADAEEDKAQIKGAEDELSSLLTTAEQLFERLEFESILNGELDANNAYLTLHAGAGGTESCDWADMLMRMYKRYAEIKEYSCELLDYQPGDEAGIKSATLIISGPYAYGYLKAERGVHRLVRISPFDSNKRRHTSFAAIDVVAEVEDDIDVDIVDGDLRVDTYRSSGAGGQHVNTTDSAIRITHIPTGIVVACQAERSQHKNRAMAMKLLKARLYEWMLDQKKKEMERFYSKKGEIAWGSQIRSYVMQPYTMVKDHRTAFETSNVNAVLDGQIEQFIEAYLKDAAGSGEKGYESKGGNDDVAEQNEE